MNECKIIDCLSNYILSPLHLLLLSLPFLNWDGTASRGRLVSACMPSLVWHSATFLWFVAALLEVGRMRNLGICPGADLFLVQCSVEFKGALAPFLLQPSRWVCGEGNQQWCFCGAWPSSRAPPLPASPRLSGEVCGLQVLTGPEMSSELLGVVKAEATGTCPEADPQARRDLLQMKA